MFLILGLTYLYFNFFYDKFSSRSFKWNYSCRTVFNCVYSQNGEHVPIVRQSLRRVLELSKQSYKEEVKDESEKESEGEEEKEEQEESEQETKEQPPQPEKPERKTEKAKNHGLSTKVCLPRNYLFT